METMAGKDLTEYTKASIEGYSNRWYEYPYNTAVNVASNVGGMEYPAIVFCGWKAKGAEVYGVLLIMNLVIPGFQ